MFFPLNKIVFTDKKRINTAKVRDQTDEIRQHGANEDSIDLRHVVDVNNQMILRKIEAEIVFSIYIYVL